MGVAKKILDSIPKEVEEINDTESRISKVTVIAESTPGCPYPVLEREIFPEKITCPTCGGLTLEGYLYCDRCGSKLENV